MTENDKGNGRVKLGEHGVLLETMADDIKEIKDALIAFQNTCTASRLETTDTLGNVKAHIRVIWGLMSALYTGGIAVFFWLVRQSLIHG